MNEQLLKTSGTDVLSSRRKLRTHERASFCLLLDQGRENESLPESRQTLDGYRSRKSGLGNLVCSRQAGFSSANI